MSNTTPHFWRPTRLRLLRFGSLRNAPKNVQRIGLLEDKLAVFNSLFYTWIAHRGAGLLFTAPQPQARAGAWGANKIQGMFSMVRKLLGKLGKGIKALNAEFKRPLGSFKRGGSQEASRTHKEAERPAVQKKPKREKGWPDLSTSKILGRASATTFGRKIEEKRAVKEDKRRRAEERLKRLTGKKEADAE